MVLSNITCFNIDVRDTCLLKIRLKRAIIYFVNTFAKSFPAWLVILWRQHDASVCLHPCHFCSVIHEREARNRKSVECFLSHRMFHYVVYSGRRSLSSTSCASQQSMWFVLSESSDNYFCIIQETITRIPTYVFAPLFSDTHSYSSVN